MLSRYARFAATLAVMALLVSAAAPACAAGDRRAAEADSLHRRALARIAEGTIESRRLALEDFDRATRIAPRRPDLWLDFASACIDVGQKGRGRSGLERAARLAPRDAAVQLALGLAWKRDWLGSVDASSFLSAQRCLAQAAMLDPDRAEAWLETALLALVRGNAKAADLAARRAAEIDSAAGEPLLVLAGAAYRLGAVERADSAFRAAIPRLSPEMRARFEDPTWMLESTPAGASGPPAHAASTASDSEGARSAPSRSAAKVWDGMDPDLTTPENEAELDYLWRLTQALLMFRREGRVHWDARTEMIVRYGAPGSVEVNPLSSPLEYQYTRHAKVYYAPDPIPYPHDVQVWSYPELGMHIVLWDASLTQTFQLPIAADYDPDPRPDPAVVDSRPELMAVGGGRGVFLAIPPGMKAMEVDAALARFPTERGARIVAHVVVPGAPTDSLDASWAVVDADGRVITRAARSLSPSACDPAGHRVAEFAADVPAGDYRVDLAVSHARGRRGLAHLAAGIAPPRGGLGLSDVVLACGAEAPPLDAVRIEPNLERRVSGSGPIAAYFEIAGLETGLDGRSRFAYRYAVRPVEEKDKGKARATVFEATREETNEGARRRQLVTVPLRSIKRGRYELEIEVRDLIAGTTAGSSVRFTKE